MRHLLARCARTDETILVTRLVQGRNARVHDHDGRPALVEKVCWELGVSTGGRRHRIPCVRPTWADRLGHFWAEPAAQEATGRSYHWDVYLSKAATPEYGLSQLNIGRWRPAAAQDGQPPPGALHHVPEGKRGRLKKESGWLC
jgi:hypothetical protein